MTYDSKYAQQLLNNIPTSSTCTLFFFLIDNFARGKGTEIKTPFVQCQKYKRLSFNPWVRKSPWRRKWQPTPVFLPGEFHGQRTWWAIYSPWGRKQSNTNEHTARKAQEECYCVEMC